MLHPYRLLPLARVEQRWYCSGVDTKMNRKWLDRELVLRAYLGLGLLCIGVPIVIDGLR